MAYIVKAGGYIIAASAAATQQVCLMSHDDWMKE